MKKLIIPFLLRLFIWVLPSCDASKQAVRTQSSLSSAVVDFSPAYWGKGELQKSEKSNNQGLWIGMYRDPSKANALAF